MINTIDKLGSLSQVAKTNSNGSTNNIGGDFSEILKNSINETNTLQKQSDQAMGDIATGKVQDLHQAAIAIDKAEISMKMMLEVRNKALNAYKEILRTQL